MLEKKLRDNVKERIQLALDQVQKEMKVDVFGFSEAFRRGYPREWNNTKSRWEDIYPKIEVIYDITAKVRRPGMVKEPAAIPDKEVEK
jgi:spore germination protein KC